MAAKRTAEDVLCELGHVVIVGGSPLYNPDVWGDNTISINAVGGGCAIAAINSNRADSRRARGRFDTIIAPRPTRPMPDWVIVPDGKQLYTLPDDWPGRQPTTYFWLCLMCQTLGIPADVYGVCGRATRHHYGDWEMWHMKHRMPLITIHDPRPAW